MFITFSSCFYIIPSKFGPETYIEWMNNFISIVNNFYLVIYTDMNSAKFINTNNNPNIKVIIKPMECFHNYEYKDYWIKNHEKNVLLNDKSSWMLNMIWSEKIHFVKQTMDNQYFTTDFYGWCDIGYFRNRNNDINTMHLKNWPKDQFFLNSDTDKICYACIKNDEGYLNFLYKLVNNINEKGLPVQQIPPYQNSIAGGFFITHKKNIEWWANTYDTMLRTYFENDYLVKDDQMILLNCIFTNLDRFTLFRENVDILDNWFMFQRILN